MESRILSKKEIPTATALMFFGQTLGGAVFLAIAQSVFNNELKSGLVGVAATSSLGPAQAEQFVALVLDTGATEIRKVVPGRLLGGVLVAFYGAITRAVYVSMGVACAGLIGALVIEWKSVKKGEGQGGKKTAEKVNAVVGAEETEKC